jgi:hypothetical protein
MSVFNKWFLKIAIDVTGEIEEPSRYFLPIGQRLPCGEEPSMNHLPRSETISYTPAVTRGTPYGSSKTHTPVIWL